LRDFQASRCGLVISLSFCPEPGLGLLEEQQRNSLGLDSLED